jgi:hypothetical protein
VSGRNAFVLPTLASCFAVSSYLSSWPFPLIRPMSRATPGLGVEKCAGETLPW